MHKHAYRTQTAQNHPEMGVRSKVWFVVEDGHAFGSGLARLLENINNYGTLRQAARHAGMSYRYAWNIIRSAEKHLSVELIAPQPGGSGGGHTVLTGLGLGLLSTFQKLNQEVAEFANRRFHDMYSTARTSHEKVHP